MRGLGLALVLVAATATAQTNQYEMQFGEPVDVSLTDLLNSPDSYIDRAVRTHGQLEMGMDLRQSYRLRDTFGGFLVIQPINDISYHFEEEARKGFGKEFEITGVFRQRNLASTSTDTSTDRSTPYAILFWAYVGPPDEKADKAAEKSATVVRLEELLSRPGKYEGKMVRVAGQFRGENLFGDLPNKSRRKGADWVIKDDVYAVWVTGRKPKGPGFSLDASLKRDTGKWMDVVGRVASVGSVVYIQASSVALGTAPRDAVVAQASPTPPPPERPKVPPVVVFALPLDGDREVPRAIRFQVQFNKDMNEESFRDRVVLRYAGRPQPGDREFTAVRLTYDGGHRALVVDPGDVLRPGRVVELLLLPGIVDMDGMLLEPRSARPVGSAVDVLRYQVAAF